MRVLAYIKSTHKNLAPKLNACFAHFAADNRGTVAIIFGLVFIALIGTVGLAIDGTRAVSVSAKTTAALDSAALATAKAMREDGLSGGDLNNVAQRFFNENTRNLGVHGVNYSNLTLNADETTGKVTLAVNVDIDTVLARVFHVNTYSFSRASTVVYNLNDIELGVMLDVTGSMSGKKIKDLREAAKDLVNILIPDNESTHVRIGLAPFATSVNAGPYASAVTDGASTSCVNEREKNAFNDKLPVNSNILGSAAKSCPSNTIFAITNKKAPLETEISKLGASGMTAGHLGIAWAWYLVSPEWAPIWPSASRPESYGTKNLIKAVILMTDGSFNTEYVSSNGKSSKQAKKLCNKMHDKNIVIYAVAFQAPSSAKKTLEKCAGESKYYFDAKNGTELRQAFRSIAIQLNNLRIAY